ncbi:MAG: selenium-dependent molybdenum cofactor biosynthesis protein YqeB [Oscillospiraceae bacterium]|nr:selenium-dependent molybdenum cofactor biosynthesis protein YqeB [Oscillospiraceae bacterium]
MLVVIKGAGDIATGVAVRLWRARFQVVMTEVPQPTTVRRTVSFSQAVYDGAARVEGIEAVRISSADEAETFLRIGRIPVLVDAEAACVRLLAPDAVVDAILAKRNPGTAISDAPVVVGVGPGFTAGADCHAVVETERGHDLGRVILEGSAAPNTGVPGEIGGYDLQRVLRAGSAGVFRQVLEIGTRVNAGDVVGTIDGAPVVSEINGILRGVLASGISVKPGMKCGDVDPRCEPGHCHSVSDKARAVGGGVLEAILRLCPGTVTLR